MLQTPSPRAERLTLAVLLCGVAALALSDFVSPVYWCLSAGAAVLRLWRGSSFSLSELQASMIGWAGFLWVGLELIMGRAWIVAFTDFLLILALAVVVEAATPRNHLHRLLTGTFLILAGAVLTDSFMYALPLAAFMWFMWRASACLYLEGLNDRAHPAPLRHDLVLMLMMVIGVAALFVTMPRFDTHTTLKGVQPRMATGGFNDKVELGSFARSLDARVAFRVEPVNIDPDPFRKAMMGRYWRGVTLTKYTGHGWLRSEQQPMLPWRRGQDFIIGGKPANNDIELAVFREASDHAFIFLPDGLKTIHNLPARGQQDAHGDTRFNAPPSRRLRLRMTLAYQHQSLLTMLAPQADEYDTRNIPPALQAWVKAQLGAQPAANAQSIRTLQQALLGWTYDLNAPLDNTDPISSFIRNKRGHCELYATTLALAARTIGVPARVVNGYYGGDWNESGQFLIMRQQEAHSWTEVWLDNRWQTIDATPPSRWSLSAIRFPQFDDVWENIRLSWYRYVLEFENSDRQALFKRMLDWFRVMLPRLVLLVMGGFACWWLWQLWQQRRPATSHNRQLQILDRWLRRHGIERPAWQPLRHVETPRDIDPDRWQQWLQAWEAQCYQAQQTPWTPRQLRQQLRDLSDVQIDTVKTTE